MLLPDFLIQDSDGFIHLAGHRIGLEHLVHYYNEGHSPEALACEYPTLSLSLIHRVIAFYLDNREEIDQYVARNQIEMDRQRAAIPKGPSLAELRDRLATTSSVNRG